MTPLLTPSVKSTSQGQISHITRHITFGDASLTVKLLTQPRQLTNRVLPTMPILFILLLNLLLPTSSFAAAKITAAVDRNPVNLEESFKITFTTDESPDGNPDFSPLEQDFTILGNSQSSSLVVNNGTATRSKIWTVEVMAKQAGKIVIPAIKFGGDTSQPLELVVAQQAANNNPDVNQELFFEVTATPETPYVQAQVLYTLRLYRKVDIVQASLTDPELADAVIEKLGDDSNYSTQLNGVDYFVTERKYAIFPQKSGTLLIKPLVLNAQIVSNSRPRFNGFFNSQITQTKRIESKAITLDVKAEPETFTGKNWLPAEQLEITQTWSNDFQQIKVGEPLTRTLTLRAKGSTVGALPELNSLQTDNKIKVYPDQPSLQEQKLPDGVVAIREEKIAIIPTLPGDTTLPAIEIQWFNTQSGTMEVTRIPETTITAIAAAGSQPLPKASPLLEQPATPQIESTPPSSGIASPGSNTWMWIALILGLGWLLTTIYFVSNRRTKGKAPVENSKHQRIEESIKQLKNACATNNAHAAKLALLEWGRHQYNSTSLGGIAQFCEARLRDEILSLNQVLYGKDVGDWQGKKLFQTFTENKVRNKSPRLVDDALEPLNRL